MGEPVDLAVVGGEVVTSEGTSRSSVLARGGRIVGVVAEGTLADARRVVDASGLVVLPGFVDTHVHLMDPGATEREDFPSGTAAAAARGVTTIVEHTHAEPVRTADDLREKMAYLRSRSHADFGLAAHVWPDMLDALPDAWRAGVCFFKIFTCSTHGIPGVEGDGLRGALEALAAIGAPALVHCEDERLTAGAERALREAGRADPSLLIEWRNREAERVAVHSVVELAAEIGGRVTIAHVSSPDVAAAIAAARSAGASIAAEACPQYLLLREDEVLVQGPLRKFTPPARNRGADDEDRMWAALGDGSLTHVASDHAPSTRAQKLAGDIWEAPFGLPGLDTTARLLLDAVATGRLGWSDLALRYARRPAELYGLAPRKGSLDVGADADMVLVDPSADVLIRDEDVLSKAAWTPYAGWRTKGDVVRVLLRGEEIASDGQPSDAFLGRFLPGAGADGENRGGRR